MDPLMIALAMLEDETCDSGLGIDEVFDDENELEYGLVVDHTPPTPVPRLLTQVQTINSLAVHVSVLKEEILDDDAIDDTISMAPL
jgi:hypothetical protein